MNDAGFLVLPELGEFLPADLAARARVLSGLVFFDSAKETSECSNVSLIGVCPERVVAGNIFNESDFLQLQDQVSRLERPSAGVGDALPGNMGAEIVAGVIDYDGRFRFGVYTKVLVYRHKEGQWRGRGDWWRSLLDAPTEEKKGQTGSGAEGGMLRFEPQIQEDRFCEMVRRAQEYIASGDVYQVNLSYPFVASWLGGDAWFFYEALRHCSPAPYGAYLCLEDETVLSTSPELFLQISGRSIKTRPIKGTRPRFSDPSADEQSAFDLITSSKELAELVMITDLERSDLGQVCEWGSVSVRELLKLESHEQVFHLVSTVEGRLRSEIDPVSALRACFPGGSITGAPKRRACEVIGELEGYDRGVYTGALGWFGAGGESVFNIAIRTVVLSEGQARFSVGAGVVADSIPEREWQETWDKAAGILLAAERVRKEAFPEGSRQDRPLPEGVSGANGKGTSL